MIHCSYNFPKATGSAKRFIALALEQAEFSGCRKRHGCIVVKHGVIIGRGFNKHRNCPSVLSPEHLKTGSSSHAEIVALRMAGTNAKGADLYVARLGAKGDPLLSRPCILCYTQIVSAGVTEIYHT